MYDRCVDRSLLLSTDSQNKTKLLGEPMKKQPIKQTKIQPRIITYVIKGKDLKGIEFDAKFKGEDHFTRYFFVPELDALFRWNVGYTKQEFLPCPLTFMSGKRRTELMEIWEKRGTEKKVKA
jgi:hypothetical protein